MKSYPSPIKVVIERAKKEREVRKAQPCRVLGEQPTNGLLVPELIDAAHRVYRARESPISSVAKLIQVVPVQRNSAALPYETKIPMYQQPSSSSSTPLIQPAYGSSMYPRIGQPGHNVVPPPPRSYPTITFLLRSPHLFSDLDPLPLD